MLSASGHGLPYPLTFFDTYWGPCPSVLNCYFSMSANLSIDCDKPWSEEEFVARHGDAIRAVTVDRIVWVHRDLRCQNILVRNGRLSEIINWENSGCHWQLHAMRNVRVAYPKSICAMWEDAEFPPETEAEFQASKTLPYYHPA